MTTATRQISYTALVNAIDAEGQAEKTIAYKFSRGNEKRHRRRDGGDGIYDDPNFRQAELDRYFPDGDPTP